MQHLPQSKPESRTNATRRTLLKAGIAGGILLVLARWMLIGSTRPRSAVGRPESALEPRARGIVDAIVPVMLAGALIDADSSVEARAEIVDGVDKAVAGLPPESRKELQQLFSLLAFAPTRCLLAGIWSPWPDAPRASVEAFLDSWRDSRFALLRSGYGALHQLILASWYGNARAWGPIGYGGPPSLKVG